MKQAAGTILRFSGSVKTHEPKKAKAVPKDGSSQWKRELIFFHSAAR
jgi:hypothetical protein